MSTPALQSGIHSFAKALNRVAKRSTIATRTLEKHGLSVPITVKQLKAHPSYADSFTKAGKLNKNGKQSVKKLTALFGLSPNASFRTIADEIVSLPKVLEKIANKIRSKFVQ